MDSLRNNILGLISLLDSFEFLLRSPLELLELTTQAHALAHKLGLKRVAEEIATFHKLIERQRTSLAEGHAEDKILESLRPFIQIFSNRLKALASNDLADENKSKVRVLIIEDSEITQLLLVKYLPKDRFAVVGKVRNGTEALSLIEKTCPDVIILDIFLQQESGFKLLETILAQHPIPIVLLSAIQGEQGIQVFDGLYRGCLDFIQKVALIQPTEQAAFSERIWKAAQAPVTSMAKYYSSFTSPPLLTPLNTQAVLAIGVSIGGIRPLVDLLTSLPSEIPPILIQQIVAPAFSKQLTLFLQDLCPFSIREAKEGEPLVPNTILVAPSGMRITVTPAPASTLHLEECLSVPGPLNSFFSSIALSGRPSVAALLGGFGHDGAEGLSEVRSHGGVTLIEDVISTYDRTLSTEALRVGAAEDGTTAEYIPKLILKALAQTEPNQTPVSGTSTPGTEGLPLDVSKSVLIVDDSPTIRAILCHGLHALGLSEFYEAQSGTEAWELILKFAAQFKTLDLIISDQKMPGMSGKQLLEKVREHPQFKDVPFILATAEAEKEQVLEAVKKGVTAYLTKPVSIETLKTRVKEVLSRD